MRRIIFQSIAAALLAQAARGQVSHSVPPVTIWTSYVGSTAPGYRGPWEESIQDLAVDPQGNVCGIGTTMGVDWTTGEDDGATELPWQTYIFMAQTGGTLLWSKLVPGTGDENGDAWGRALVIDPHSGAIFIAGSTGSGGIDPYSADVNKHGKRDIFVIKLTGEGEILWSKRFGGSESEIVREAKLDPQGNLLVLGASKSIGWLTSGVSDGSTDEYSQFVFKLSDSGDLIQSRAWGAQSTIAAWAITLDQGSGAVYLAGTHAGRRVVQKLSSSLDPLWTTVCERSNYPECAIEVDLIGEVFLCGPAGSSNNTAQGGFDTTYNGGSSDMLATRLSPGGQIMWTTWIGGNEGEDCHDLVVDEAGEIYIYGATQSRTWTPEYTDVQIESHSGRQPVVVKLSREGEVQWIRQAGGWANDELESTLAYDSLGNLFFGGATGTWDLATGGFDTALGGQSDGFLGKIKVRAAGAPSSAPAAIWQAYP